MTPKMFRLEIWCKSRIKYSIETEAAEPGDIETKIQSGGLKLRMKILRPSIKFIVTDDL